LQECLASPRRPRRFADIDLTRLRPWCDQSDRQCCRMPSGSAKNCNLALEVCCASCSSSLVGGVHQCGGTECSKAGPSSQCCSGTILAAAQDCACSVFSKVDLGGYLAHRTCQRIAPRLYARLARRRRATRCLTEGATSYGLCKAPRTCTHGHATELPKERECR
jgi:hypothetical protein